MIKLRPDVEVQTADEWPTEWMRRTTFRNRERGVLALEIDLAKWHAEHKLPFTNLLYARGLITEQLTAGLDLFFQEFLPEGARDHIELNKEEKDRRNGSQFVDVHAIVAQMFSHELFRHEYPKKTHPPSERFARLDWTVVYRDPNIKTVTLNFDGYLYHVDEIQEGSRVKTCCANYFKYLDHDWLVSMFKLDEILEHVNKVRELSKSNGLCQLELDALEARLRKHFQ